ncbi:MAG: DUF302 domain-containing protein [Desulfuromonadales bacterium]|nr:DUF302 domain-containing protein [Desulfuromonadales bacterium]
MPVDCSYGFGCEVGFGFDEAIEKVQQLLTEKGFQIYTRLNLHEIVGETEHDKFGRYIIIGACNAEFARQLFNADPDIGLLMPCNIIIYELHSGGCKVMIKDPARVMDMITSPVAIETSIHVKCLMEEIIEDLQE